MSLFLPTFRNQNSLSVLRYRLSSFYRQWVLWKNDEPLSFLRKGLLIPIPLLHNQTNIKNQSL